MNYRYMYQQIIFLINKHVKSPMHSLQIVIIMLKLLGEIQVHCIRLAYILVAANGRGTQLTSGSWEQNLFSRCTRSINMLWPTINFPYRKTNHTIIYCYRETNTTIIYIHSDVGSRLKMTWGTLFSISYGDIVMKSFYLHFEIST